MKMIKTFASDESGATAIEYALMAALIAVVLISVLTGLGSKVSSVFSQISSGV